jgi:hypothetical protein
VGAAVRVHAVAVAQQRAERGGDRRRLEKRVAPQAGRGVEQVVSGGVPVERGQPVRNAAAGALDTAREHVSGDGSVYFRRRRWGQQHVALHDEALHKRRVVSHRSRVVDCHGSRLLL